MLVLVFSCRKEIKACLGANRPPVFDFSMPWQIGQRKCQLLLCGMGPLTAFRTLRLFLTQQQVSGVVNLGLAGAYNESDWKLGQTAIVTHEIWPEDESVPAGSFFGEQMALQGRELVLDPALAARRMGLYLPAGKVARAITVKQPSAALRGKKLRLLADVENMEGFALALACQAEAVPFLEIRTIANYSGETQRNKAGFSRACPALHKALAELGF